MTATDEEVWVPVAGYEGLYDVSTHGRVRSYHRYHRIPGTVLKIHVGKSGYPTVTLARDGDRGRTVRIHTIMAPAFLGPRPPGTYVRHLDDDKLNSHISNLAYGTPSDNGQDAIANGHNHNVNKTHCKHGHEFTPENTRIWVDANGTKRACKTCARRTGLAGYHRRKVLKGGAA